MLPLDSNMSPAEGRAASTVIQDRRPKPPGVLPRNIQMWLMTGIALVILTIIFFTGRTTPPVRTVGGEKPAESPLALTERIRTYRQQLAEDQARQERILAQEKALPPEVPRPASPDTATRDGLAEERRRRDYQSLFADSVAFSRRGPSAATNNQPKTTTVPSAASPATDIGRVPQPPQSIAPGVAPTADAVPLVPAAASRARDLHAENPAPGPRRRLLEGTVIEAVLTNRLDGTLAGPVNAMVTGAVYSQDRQAIVIPAGARVLGAATPVQSWGESRLAVSFHRLVMPDGHTYSLDTFKGLDQIGETGLRDQVNRHYLQVFGASVAIGAISGLAQFNTRSGFDYTFADAYRQAAGASLATSTARVLDRYLNVLPTITIREGYRLKVYLTNDLELPAYTAEPIGEIR